MKKETKRYLLVEYYGTKTINYSSEEELQTAIDNIRRYNNRKTAKYICGNIKIEKSIYGYSVFSHIYHKLTNRMTISDLDQFTSQFNEEELNNHYSNILKTKEGYTPDINVAFFETKNKDENVDNIYFGVKYIPVLYQDDIKYTNVEYIAKCIMFHANCKDIEFFRALADEFKFYNYASKELDDLIRACNRVENEGYSTNYLQVAAMNLYNRIIHEEKNGVFLRDENGFYLVSRRRLRDFGFFTKNYNGQHKSPLRYNGKQVNVRKLKK